MTNPDAVIFDIDGTLWNASQSTARGWNNALANSGIDITVTSEQIESVAGNPYEKCVDIVLPGLKEQYSGLISALNESEMRAVAAYGGIFYDNVIDGIKDLASDHKIFLVSNCQDWYMKLFLRFSKLDQYLSGFDCFGMSGLSKDKMLTRIKRAFSLNNPVYVGDTAGDENAAKLAGIDFIHVEYGFGKPQNKALSFPCFKSLTEYLKNGRRGCNSH